MTYWAEAQPATRNPKARPATNARMGVTPSCILLSFNTFVNVSRLRILHSRPSWSLPAVSQVLLKQFENPFVFVSPARGFYKAVIFNRIYRQTPVLLA